MDVLGLEDDDDNSANDVGELGHGTSQLEVIYSFWFSFIQYCLRLIKDFIDDDVGIVNTPNNSAPVPGPANPHTTMDNPTATPPTTIMITESDSIEPPIAPVIHSTPATQPTPIPLPFPNNTLAVPDNTRKRRNGRPAAKDKSVNDEPESSEKAGQSRRTGRRAWTWRRRKRGYGWRLAVHLFDI